MKLLENIINETLDELVEISQFFELHKQKIIDGFLNLFHQNTIN